MSATRQSAAQSPLAWEASAAVTFVLIWSTGFVVAKEGLPYADTMTFVSLRFGIACVLTGALAVVGRASWPGWRLAGHVSVVGVLIHTAYEIIDADLRQQYGVPMHQAKTKRWVETGFTVIGMGKLGGHELNYSSDVDLIYLYEAHGGETRAPKGGRAAVPAGVGISNEEYFEILARELTRVLSEPTGEGHIFRVDLRLRAEGSVGQLARSLDEYQRYYTARGQVWERLALLKAAPVAGSQAVGQAFLKMVRPFVLGAGGKLDHDQALAIVTRLASAPDAGNRQTLVYTDILSRFFISAPAWLAHAVLALSALVAFGAFWSGGADRRWRTLGLPVLSLVFAALLGAAAWALLDFVIRPGDMNWWAHPEVARAWCIALGLLGAPLAMLTLRGGLRSAQLGASGQFWFAALGALLALLLPGISILFVVPAVLYALGVVIGFAWNPARPVGAMLAALTSLLIWAPMLALNELALGFQFPFANTMLFALTALPWLGLLAELQGAARWRWTALALGAVGAVGIVLAVLTPAATPDRPLPLNFYYFLNTTTHDARVLAGSAKRSLPAPVISAMAFAPQLMLPGDKVPYWAAPATVHAVAAPAFENMTVEARGDARVMHATLRMNGVYRLFIRIPLAAGASKVRLNGVDADFRDTGSSTDDSDYVTLACQGRACDGVDVEITLGAGAQDWSLIGITSGVSGQAASIPRPADRTAIQFGDSTVTLTMLHV